MSEIRADGPFGTTEAVSDTAIAVAGMPQANATTGDGFHVRPEFRSVWSLAIFVDRFSHNGALQSELLNEQVSTPAEDAISNLCESSKSRKHAARALTDDQTQPGFKAC